METIRFILAENVLTPRCPNCKIAFLDFKGCFAVNCNQSVDYEKSNVMHVPRVLTRFSTKLLLLYVITMVEE